MLSGTCGVSHHLSPGCPVKLEIYIPFGSENVRGFLGFFKIVFLVVVKYTQH